MSEKVEWTEVPMFDPNSSDSHAATYVDTDGSTVIYRASSFGRCMRGLVASRLGITPIPPSEHMEKIFAAGHASEEQIEELLRADGWRELTRQQATVELWFEGVKIRGHIDAVGIDPDGDQWLMEYKSFSPDHYDRFVSKPMDLVSDYPAYAYQTSIYGLALDLPVMFVVGRREEDGTVSEKSARAIYKPLLGRVEISERLAEIERYVAAEEYPACPSKKDYPCPFIHIHEEDDALELDDAEFDSWAAKWELANSAEKAAKESKDEAKAAMAKVFDREGVKGGRIKTKSWVVNDVVSTRVTLDRAKVSGKLGEDLGAYENRSDTRYQMVKAAQ